MQAYAERLLAAESLAREAGAIIRDAFIQRNTLYENKNSTVDFVTETDRKCEQIITDGIRKLFQQDGIVGEEGTDEQADAEFRWHVDPLDGTVNFIRGLPICCVSIGITHNGEPVVGCIYDPNHDELFAAISGKGATRNGLPMQTRESVLDSLMIEIGHFGKREESLHNAVDILNKASISNVIFRDTGSAALALAWLADGRFDAMVSFGLNSWDYMAGWVLIKEAGGVVADFNGEHIMTNHGGIAAANEAVLKHLQNLKS